MISEIKEAIAAQEEHIKRSLSCQEARYAAHAFRQFGSPDSDGTVRSPLWSECVVCGVTETSADYKVKMRTR